MEINVLVERMQALIADGERRLLGIAGPPGSAKSTIARGLADAMGPRAAVVPMDGFHLANEELVRLGRRERKGAPDTFDVPGFKALLDRLREDGPEIIYAPRFDRPTETAVAGAIPIDPEARLVIVEGNYLLLDRPDWGDIRSRLDEAWFLQLSDETRRSRLLARRARAGDSADDARAWVDQVDEPNARIIAPTAARADVVIRLEG
ncbi:nucleoside/nucleotide kinase family protein [Granulicoccus sp. GXG6511]|uniref:nucleoside/nucleotide kinase family protein n=1 Tax=Granulicoccus sp. GXG6511 TaxID=3381351 RepID=UPI003D7C5B1C